MVIEYEQQKEKTRIEDIDVVFYSWHNDRYLRQCLYNLQEKYDCGGISDTEWQAIEKQYGDVL